MSQHDRGVRMDTRFDRDFGFRDVCGQAEQILVQYIPLAIDAKEPFMQVVIVG